MNPPLYTELPYHPDTAVLFDAVADEPWAVWLDSGDAATQGRYDIVCARPFATVTAAEGQVTVTQGGITECTRDDPLQVLRALLGTPVARSELPFAGGAVGYFGYDLGRRFEGLDNPEGSVPELMAGLYDWALVVDHTKRRSRLVGQGRDLATKACWRDLVALFSAPVARSRNRFVATGPVIVEPDRAGYARAFARVQDYIRSGDCYQINFARRFRLPVAGDPWEGYRRLRAINAAPFSAYLNFPDFQILSASPERFLQVRAGCVEARPIKGTRPRSDDPNDDARLAQELRASPKDRAENVMIVDLLRNDLGKRCAIGSVAVPRLFEIESFATVHHLVSTVTGRLAAGADACGLLRACLPGGSITGAPKRRAMEIIEELEPGRREVYCGAIGYLGFDGDMDTNIAIRTLLHQNGKACFWAGGGIVADSSLEGEFDETLHKAAGMLRLFELCGGPEERWRKL